METRGSKSETKNKPQTSKTGRAFQEEALVSLCQSEKAAALLKPGLKKVPFSLFLFRI
jgi:hypothetical protein